MSTNFKMSAVGFAAALITSSACALVPDTGCDDCTYTSGPGIPDATPNLILFDNTSYTVQMDAPGYWSGSNFVETEQTAGWFTDFVNGYIFGGGNDRGDWKCSTCSVVPTLDGATEWGAFITTVVNAQLWPTVQDDTGKYIGQWKPGDTIGICNGSGICVVLTWRAGNGTVGWLPDLTNPGKVIKADKGKYKNKEGQASAPANNSATPVYDPNGNLMLLLVTSAPIVNVSSINIKSSPTVTITITVGPVIPVNPATPLPGDTGGPPPPPPPPPSGGGGGGGGGGGSCVHVDSFLPDGRRAGDIEVGDAIQLGDESTADLQSRVGIVTYSKRAMARGFRIATQSGVGLLCSETAPIWTDEGFVLAPDLLGKKIAVRIDGADSATRFEIVEMLIEVGMIEVQHISVGERAFWAGETMGAYVLHHNKTPEGDDDLLAPHAASI